MRRPYIEEACEEIDASIFSGDILFCDEDREMLSEYIARWQRALDERTSEATHE
jgi:hypothetical protein